MQATATAPSSAAPIATRTFRIVPRAARARSDHAFATEGILTALDALDVGVGLYSDAGVPLAQTASLVRLLAVAGEELRAALRSAVHSVVQTRVPAYRGTGRPRIISVGTATHVVRASLCEPRERQAVLVHVSPVIESPMPMTDAELRVAYHLTPAEMRVTRLLAEGRPNRDIAEALGLSEHTARHYTERVLRKLGVRRRVEVMRKVGPTAPATS